MFIIKRTPHLQKWITEHKKTGHEIGFVPTMGALHEGHLSLMKQSIADCDLTVVSIFVNPKQFNDPQDLVKYPRPLEQDLAMLMRCGVDALFLPDVDDIYTPGQTPVLNFDPGALATVMEGKFRPGHFKGVAEVMNRLLSITQPDMLYMGQKDFQQLTIVRKMISDLHFNTHLIMCPTLREANGLAMSSRNTRLSQHARDEASLISTTLTEAQRMFEESEPVEMIKQKAIASLTRPGFSPEYFSIVDGLSLEEIHDQRDSQFVVACTAVNVEGVRLIDNMIWTRSE